MAQQSGAVNVSMADVINQLHNKYGRTIAQLMQESAESQAVIDTQSREIDELKSRVEAMTPRPA